ncbi:hypothetical protein [Actinophytocola sp. KF-1]
MTAADHDAKMPAYLARFGELERTPLLGFVEDGYPFSVVCAAEWLGNGEFRITTKWPSLGPSDPERAASLLWHHHDDNLEDQRSMSLSGWLRADGDGVVFRMSGRPALNGLEPVDEEEMFRRFDRAAEKYLADHGLEPPVVNRTAFEALIAEVRGANAE